MGISNNCKGWKSYIYWFHHCLNENLNSLKVQSRIDLGMLLLYLPKCHAKCPTYYRLLILGGSAHLQVLWYTFWWNETSNSLKTDALLKGIKTSGVVESCSWSIFETQDCIKESAKFLLGYRVVFCDQACSTVLLQCVLVELQSAYLQYCTSRINSN